MTRALLPLLITAATAAWTTGFAAPIGTTGSGKGKPTEERPADPAKEPERRGDRALRVEPRQTRTKRTAPAAPATPEKGAKRGRAERPSATREKRPTPDESSVARAAEAVSAGRYAEARLLLEGIDPTTLSRGRADDAAYLKAVLLEDGAKQEAAFADYLKEYGGGTHRREATLSLARIRYVLGDYAESERLLAIFSPGVEKDPVGRDGLVLRGLAQLGRGDASGALQFLASCESDLKGSPTEEPYYFARSQAALRASKPQQALDALRVLLERHPQGAYAPQALYAMGVGLEMMGRGPDAANVFRQVAQRFPQSYEATRVRDRGIRPGAVTAAGLPIGGGYALQIGAFSRRDLADALARDLRHAGLPDVTVKQGNESPPVYRVRAGAFASRDEARAFGERLRRERGFSSTVVPR
ncbi:MAG TPA: SPOR domain-containing protein [Acidobacteriota bacterium]|nr:SPOR domain-containing protein [Acidobacteriota bacterium]